MPDSWCIVPLGNVCILNEGEPIADREYPYIDVKGLRTGDYASRQSGKYIPAGTTLILVDGENSGEVFHIPLEGYQGSTMKVLDIDRNMNAQYVLYFVKLYQKALRENKVGSAIPHLNKKMFRELIIPVPPIEEQNRIVSAIEQWFTLINILEDAKDDLQNLISQAKSKILDLAIHGKLVPQDPTDEPAIELLKRINPKFTLCDNEHYGNLPNGWCICRIRDLFQICMGQSPAGTSINQNDGMEFHQGKICFTDKFLGQSKILTNSPTKIADANSLLICVRAPVGVLNINTRQICIGRGLCALLPSKCVNLGFAFHCLTTYQQQFEQKSTGSTFKAISGDIIKNELFPLPPLAEQHRIVAKIEELFAQLDAIENSLQA